MPEFLEHAAVLVDGGQNLRQGHQVHFGQDVPRLLALHLVERRRQYPEVARRPDFQIWVGAIARGPVRGFVLLLQGGLEFSQDRLRIVERRQAGPLEKFRPLPLPSLPADQVIIQGAILAGPIEVQAAGLDRRGDVLEEKHLAERDPEPLRAVRHGITFGRIQKRQGHARADAAVLFAEICDRSHQIRRACIANEPDLLQDRADPVLQANGTILEDVMEQALIGGSALADVGPQDIHDTVPVAIEHGPDAVQLPCIGHGLVVEQDTDPVPQVGDFRVDVIQQFLEACARSLAPCEDLVLVFPIHGCPERLHDTEKHVDRGILKPVVLIGDEGNGMEITVGVRAALQLEHFRSVDTARVVSDTFGPDVEDLEDGCDLPVQLRQDFQVGDRLPDLARAGGLRDLAEQRQPVPVPPILLHEQAVEHHPQLRRQVLAGQAYEIFLSFAQPCTDQIGQPPCTGKLNPVCDQKVDAVPENDPGFEMAARHLRDFRDQPAIGLIVERPEALQVQYACLTAKPAHLGIAVRHECIERQIK